MNTSYTILPQCKKKKHPMFLLQANPGNPFFPAFATIAEFTVLDHGEAANLVQLGFLNQTPDGLLKASFTDLTLKYNTDCQHFADHCSSYLP